MIEYIDESLLDFSKLPDNVTISTISATCSLGIDFNLQNMYKYIALDLDGIFTIKYLGNVKSLKKQKKKKKKSKAFQNQMTVEIKPDLKEYPNSKISVKIFKNGSIQMSGIKNITACNTVLNKLINILKQELGIIVDGKIVDIKFVDNPDNILVKNFKIDMINSGFKMSYEINRKNLYNILLEKNVESRFEPAIHAGVNIKFYPKKEEEILTAGLSGEIDNILLDTMKVNIKTKLEKKKGPKKVSIFVFESGNVIITGAKNISHILQSYSYIYNFLEDNKDLIEKPKFSKILLDTMNDELKELMNVEDDDDLVKLAISEMNYN